MMYKSKFLKESLNKQIEYDNVAYYQCVDYIKQYLHDCFGISPGSCGDAKYYFLRFDDPKWAGYKQMNKYFKRIEGKVQPQFGDIVVFNGTYGHVGVADGVSDNKGFWMYEQNWNSKKYVQRNRHFYSDMLGVLRPKFWSVNAKEGLNIRQCAFSNAEIIGLLKNGEFKEFTEERNGWMKLKDSGWCFKKYLD